MVKVCEDAFPMGSYKGQEKPGYYMDGYTKQNLDVFVRKIPDDMQFVGLVSGNGTVRNGKSTLAMQMGYYYSSEVSKNVGSEVPFSVRNIVFKTDDLIETAMKLPRYSCIILDEGDDLTAHYFSKLTQKLNKFFRKCGQLNLFIILILPDFFELKRGIAITRSNFLCNVKFMGEFERGFYDFYGPKNKKWLYIMGKKYNDYTPKGVHNDFSGRFVGLYPISEKAYREKKRRDLEEDDAEELSTKQMIRQERVRIVGKFRELFPEITQETLSRAFETSIITIKRYCKEYITKEGGYMGSIE